MAAGQSGFSLTGDDIPIVLGMAARGDRKHDIAAWFGVNQGRIAEAEDGKWGTPAAAPSASLPPKGAPGIKGRRLRDAVAQALGTGDVGSVRKILEDAAAAYDADET